MRLKKETLHREDEKKKFFVRDNKSEVKDQKTGCCCFFQEAITF